MIHQGKEKILLVEDSESDRFVYRRYLKADTENQYEILEAETLAEGLELWRSQSPNLALVDLHLPDGSGLELLEAITALPQDLQIPVIVMTGQGDEKIAVQTLKQGAIDYLVKGDITALTLCRAIRQGLDEGMFPRKVRQLQQQIEIQNSVLKFKDDLFQAIFDNTFQFTGLIAPDGTALEANQTALAVAGLKKEEVIGRPIWETEWFKISRQTQEKLRQSVARAAQGEFIRYEMDIWGANQRVIPIDFSLRPMFNESGEVIYIIPEGRDITDAKRLLIEREQALAALKVQKDFNQLIAEISSRFGEVTDETLDFEINRSLQLTGEMSQVDTAYLFTFDRDRQTLSMSHEWSQSGSLRQIAIAQNVPFAAFPYSIALILRQQYCCVKDTALLPPEAAVDAAGWQQFNIKSLLSIPLIRNGQTIGMLGLASFSRAIAWDEESIRVLTILSQTIANTQARIEAENIRKQNEIELAEWHKRYELAEQASGQMVYEYNFLTNSVIWGANAKLILGYAESDLPLHLSDWMSLIHPEDLSIFQQALEIANIHQTPFFAQYRFRHQAGHYVWLEDRNQWLLNEQGEGIGVVGMIADISDQKKVELLLKKQALVFENITDGVIITDLDGIIIDWNRGAENLYGYTKTEMLGKSPSILHKTEEGQRLATEINQTTLQKGHWSGELIVVCKDGTEKITATSTVYLQDIQKNNIALIGFNHDITNLKKIEEELRQSHEQLQQLNQELETRVKERTYELETREAELFDLFDNATDLIQRVSPEGKLLFVNRAWRESLGYCDHELEQLSIFQIIHPSDLEHCQAMMARIFAGETCLGIETRFLTKDGKEIIVQGNVNCQFQHGQAIATRGIFQNISDRKQTELKLQQSEEINRTILEAIPDLLIHKDIQGNYLLKSKGDGVRVIGLEDSSLQLKVEDILPSHLAQQQLYFTNLALETGTLQIFEQIVDFPNERRFEEVRIAPLNQQEVLIIIRDISDRKKTEIALRESEEFNRHLITEFPIGLASCRLDGQLVYINSNFAQILGRTVEETLNLTYWDITPIKYQEQEVEQLRQLQETGSYGPYEKEYIHKDGHLVAVTLTGLLIQQKGETLIWSSVQDISDRKQAEQQLQNLTNRLKIALNSGAIGCWEWEIGNSIVTWDERVYELYGIPVETTVVFETFVNSLYPDDRQATLTLVQEAVAGKAEYDTEFRVIHPDGSIHFLKCYGAVMRDDQGNPLRVIGVNFEITEQKQAEQTIRQQAEKETLLRQITQRIRESLNLQTIFDTACQEIRQFIQSDRVGIFRFYPESGFDDGEFVAESLKEGCSSVLAIRIHDHCFGEDYAKSYTEGHFQVINDVLQSNLQECHKAVLSQFQIRANLVIPILCGQKLWGLLCIHTCTAPRIWQPDEIDLIQQIAGQLAISIQQANLLEQLQQELKERQVAQQQLTERNQQLALSNEELARATRLKDEFLANMSHELRTPLNAILGMTEGLQEQVYGPINPKQLRSLQTIERSGFHLLGLINEILDLAKIESGQLELECGPTAIAPLCRSSLAFIKQQALNKRIQIQTQIPQDLPDIWIDERRIRQVLINLLNNAVKFTPEGGNVTLEATLAVNSAMASLVSDSSPSTQTCLRIAIIDNGIGITPENIPKLFQPFIQVDSALNRQYEGTGLGLALVKRLVELHGGRVSLTSEFGKGSCFTIDLPCPHRERFSSASSPELETENRTESISLQTRRSSSILLVEDNPASASTIVNYLEAKGYRLILAENGEKAIALAQSEKPDLILMDIQMPGMDGLEAIKQIRLNANLAQIPIIALTALAMPGDRDRCLEVGANEYVSKPVRLKQLTSLMQDLLNSSQD
jgi:PAS domain S-box-containing protein